MIKIDLDKTHLNNIMKKYAKHIKDKLRSPESKNVVFDFYKSLLPDIIECRPEKFNAFHIQFKSQPNFNKSDFNDFRIHMEEEYKRLFKNIFTPKTSLGTWLAEALQVNVCPYCNRQYTFTVKKSGGEKGVRPQFDHFHPKSSYPYLALSFYNLIPSCPTCNHAKGEEEIDINPYISGFNSNCRFVVDRIDKCIFQEKDKVWNVILPYNGNHISHVKEFALNKLYNQHKDYVEEIVFKAQAYNDDYYTSLISSFSELGLTENEMNRIIFGNYIDPSDYSKRPLSKLTADILHQLDVKI